MVELCRKRNKLQASNRNVHTATKEKNRRFSDTLLGKMKNKAKGINTVRNRLLMHPEGEKKQEPILMTSYSWGNDGPMFKNARPAGDTFEVRDCGLWINAQEFKDDFEELLQIAIKS